MKIGVITDVHANIEALEVVLFNLRTCDHIVCLGDICNFGANADECFNLVRQLNNFTMIMGNHEAYINASVNNVPLGDITDVSFLSYLKYMANRLSESNLEYISSLSKEYTITKNNVSILFTHFPWKNAFEVYPVKKIPLEFQEFREVFAFNNAEYVFFGHTHQAQESFYNNVNYINFGSLGIPDVKKPSIAPYGIVEIKNGKVLIERKIIEYDYTANLKKVHLMNHPYVSVVIKKFFDL